MPPHPSPSFPPPARRNAAFAAWASAVGCAYGFLFIATGSLWVPALAHSAANLASAALWKARHSCTW